MWQAMLIDKSIIMIGIAMLTVSNGTTIQSNLAASNACASHICCCIHVATTGFAAHMAPLHPACWPR